jgi:hypothetical protein
MQPNFRDTFTDDFIADSLAWKMAAWQIYFSGDALYGLIQGIAPKQTIYSAPSVHRTARIGTVVARR